jgi:N-acetyl-alpha-D-muramate 1-phosphate uridylyltransferase
MKAILFAAGLGTRLKPFTDQHPKALAMVKGKTLLQRNIEYLQLYGIRDVLVNVHHFAGQIVDAVNSNKGFGSAVTISDESDAVLETGGGLKKAAWYFEGNEPFVVMNVDILTNLNLQRMTEAHLQKRPIVTMGVTTRETSRYFLFNEKNILCGWENTSTGERRMSRDEPGLTRKAYSCVNIFEPALLPLIWQEGKFSLVDVYLDVAKQHDIIGYDHTGDLLCDVGKPESIVRAEAFLEMRIMVIGKQPLFYFFISPNSFCILNISSRSLAASMKSRSRAACSISFLVLAMAFSSCGMVL